MQPSIDRRPFEELATGRPVHDQVATSSSWTRPAWARLTSLSRRSNDVTLAIVRALVHALLVLESSGPDVINPDTVVRGMENVASSLLALEESEQRVVRGYFAQIAGEASDEAYRKFVQSLADMLGLAD
jgi:hypothetical protein